MANTLTIQNQGFTIAANWDEIVPKRRRWMLPYLLKDTPANRLELLYQLGGNRLRNHMRSFAKREPLESDRALQVLGLLDWMYKPAQVKEPSEQVHPIIEHFSHRGTRYYLPMWDAKDMTLHEWTVAQQFMKQYFETPSAELERRIVATVCRPRRSHYERNAETWDGYPRLHFNEERIPYYERQFAQLHAGDCYAVIEFLARLAQMIQLRYGIMFEGEASKGNNFGWWGTIINLTGDDPARMKEVRKMNLHEACVYICKKILDRREQKQKINTYDLI